MEFLPQDYQAPKANSGYMKIQDGENKIRILSRPILGWEDWQEKKPLRYHMDEKPAKPYDPAKPIRHFWAFIVWNYNEQEIQILEITQATIRKSLEALCKDSDWGAPYFYDIKITKKGEMTTTEYSINPIPHRPIDPTIILAFKEKPCQLHALFDAKDPFSPDHKYYTPLQIELEHKKEASNAA